MNFNNLDAVLFTAAFLVPGFVWATVLSMFLPRRTVGSDVRFLEFLTLSCINCGLWSWALLWAFKGGGIDQHPFWCGLALFGIIFVSPITLGLFSALLQQRDLVGRLLRRMGYRTIDVIPTAWDWQFSREKAYWVLVTLKNGSRIYGLYDENSFAGDDPACRDLYLEAMFRLLQNGEWAPVEDTGGVLIMADQIAAIEFRNLLEVHDE